jgi:hypothetical protein
MAEEKKKTAKSGRERLTGRYSGKYPDRKWDEEGSDGDIFGLAADELEGYDREREESAAQRKQFNDMFNRDPMSASMVRSWAKGESTPISYLVTKFGDKLKEALDSEEGKKEFAAAHEKYLEKEAADARADAEYVEAMGKSLETLKSFGAKNGLSDEQQVDLFMKAHQFVQDAIDGVYTEDFFKMVYDGENYSKDVARARTEGEVAGRNAKISRELRKTNTAKMMPPSLGGRTFDSEENEQEKKPSRIPMFGIPAAGKNNR